MIWQIKISATAEKQLGKLDKKSAQRIYKFLNNRLASLDNPRSIGESLKGSRFGEFWRYRVGSYRIISKIEDKQLIILIIRIGHRKKIYN